MTVLGKIFKPLAKVGIGACIGGAVVYITLDDQVGFVKWRKNDHLYSKWDSNWDKRDPTCLVKRPKSDDEASQNAYNEKLAKIKSKATRHIFLIRHGQYNTSGRSDAERRLTELGERQAALTGERLKELNYPFSILLRSTMTRANQTAKIIEKHLPEGLAIKDCPMLEEGAPIQPEPPSSSWKPALYFHVDGSRIEAAFRKYIHRAPPEQDKDSYELVVCHANVIRYFVCRALQLPPNAWLRFGLNHASITWIQISPSGRVHLRCYGDTGYMPPEVITSS